MRCERSDVDFSRTACSRARLIVELRVFRRLRAVTLRESFPWDLSRDHHPCMQELFEIRFLRAAPCEFLLP